VRKIVAAGSALAGINAGKGFADLDITLFGIGGHRNWFFHSAATSALLYGAAKWYMKKLEEEGCDDARKKALKYIGAPLMAAFSVANAAHLFADMCGAKDVVGWPVGILLRGGMWKDRIWLGANGLICLGLAWKFVRIAVSKKEEPVTINEGGTKCLSY